MSFIDGRSCSRLNFKNEIRARTRKSVTDLPIHGKYQAEVGWKASAETDGCTYRLRSLAADHAQCTAPAAHAPHPGHRLRVHNIIRRRVGTTVVTMFSFRTLNRQSHTLRCWQQYANARQAHSTLPALYMLQHWFSLSLPLYIPFSGLKPSRLGIIGSVENLLSVVKLMCTAAAACWQPALHHIRKLGSETFFLKAILWTITV